jgi:sugar phosphate isomerase/epimerase
MPTRYDLARNLGVKSFSFRHITDNADVAAAILRCGSHSVDLSACHVNYDDPEQQERAVATYRAAGVRISGIGVVHMRNDSAHNLRFFEFARRAGCTVVSCTFPLADHEAILRDLETLCSRFGMRVAIHNHGGTDWLGNTHALDYVFARTGPAIGLCLDTAWCIQAGGDPVQWLEKFGPRLHALHLKDFTFDPAGHYRDTIIGEGALKLPEFLEKFRALSFDGSAVVEYEGDDAVEATARCVTAVRVAWAGISA